ncbi:cytochrome oxidase [Endozoicomonas sp. (ex Bugula neritina AB1)]|nr:cytochrome oxidase [Endozoicomonas sp. (ex Bugula neritina AB1)]
MDINTVRGLATLLALVAFVSMLLWVYSSKRKHAFDEAAELPFADEITPSDHHQNKQQNSHNRGVEK